MHCLCAPPAAPHTPHQAGWIIASPTWNEPCTADQVKTGEGGEQSQPGLCDREGQQSRSSPGVGTSCTREG